MAPTAVQTVNVAMQALMTKESVPLEVHEGAGAHICKVDRSTHFDRADLFSSLLICSIEECLFMRSSQEGGHKKGWWCPSLPLKQPRKGCPQRHTHMQVKESLQSCPALCQ